MVTQMKMVDIPKEFRMAKGTLSKEWAGTLNVTGEDKSGRMSCRSEVGTLRRGNAAQPWLLLLTRRNKQHAGFQDQQRRVL